MKIKFQLTKFEKGLSFQILYQTDKWLNTDHKLRKSFKYSSNLTLVSEHSTRFNLNEMELHLWGASEASRDEVHNTSGYEITSTTFLSNEVRDEWHDYILETLEDWANNCDDFQDENQTGDTPMTIIYQKFEKLDNDIYII